ncbi:DUF4238 domain-containing protein [Microbulbifer sp. TRSA005]|uniref:DUF4238 domain-containing protein n=1 Tax=Microbulbifer sp. TRSA005 TaxID=3243383 RepID=UPI00403A048D
MGRKAKHHYIPKCYLKEFTIGGEDTSPFWCVPINNNTPFQTSPNDACAKRDYYTVQHSNSLIVEDWYAEEIEPKIKKGILHIKEHSSLPPKEEMPYLFLLLATLYLRVPSFRNLIESPLKRTREITNSIAQDIKIRNKSEFEYDQTDIIMSELRLIDTVQTCLSNKYFQLHVIDDTKSNVVTSDSPFILSHPNSSNGYCFGLNTPMVEICVPITKHAIIIARNEKITEGSFKATEQLIGLTNTKVILSADRFFYSTNSEILLVNDNLSTHKHKISTKKDVTPA